jgi:hypothetical protein
MTTNIKNKIYVFKGTIAHCGDSVWYMIREEIDVNCVLPFSTIKDMAISANDRTKNTPNKILLIPSYTEYSDGVLMNLEATEQELFWQHYHTAGQNKSWLRKLKNVFSALSRNI